MIYLLVVIKQKYSTSINIPSVQHATIVYVGLNHFYLLSTDGVSKDVVCAGSGT